MSKTWESENKDKISSLPQAIHTTYSTHHNPLGSFQKYVPVFHPPEILTGLA